MTFLFWAFIVLVAVVLIRRHHRKKLARAKALNTAPPVFQADHPEGKVNLHTLPKDDYINLRPDVMRQAEIEAEEALLRDRIAKNLGQKPAIVGVSREEAARVRRSSGLRIVDSLDRPSALQASRPDTRAGETFAAAAAGALLIGTELGLIPVTAEVTPDGTVVDQPDDADDFGVTQDAQPVANDSSDDGDDDSSDSHDSD